MWLATHLQLETPAAVKFMHAALGRDLVQRFEREAKACARLNSPHIVKVYDFGEVESVPFMVMEYLEGETASERLRRQGVFSLESAAVLMDALAKGLTVAHDAGIVHRDLKPANVFFARVGNDEVVKIVDFGIARESSRRAEDRTETGIVLGSPHHMSPEQAGGLEVDGRSDAWSVGVLLYQLLTGKRPFDGNGMSAVVYAIATSTPAPPSSHNPDVPTSLDAFFRRALERDVGSRFQTMGEMDRAFKAAVAAPRPRHSAGELSVERAEVVTPMQADPVTPFPTGSQVLRGLATVPLQPKRTSRAAMAVGAVLAVSLGAGFAVWASRAPAPASSASSSEPTVLTNMTAPTVVVAPASSAAGPAAGTVVVSAAFSVSAPTAKSSPALRPPPTGTPAVSPPAPKTASPPNKGCPSGKTRDAFTGLCVSG